jgi:hypothetical protein
MLTVHWKKKGVKPELFRSRNMLFRQLALCFRASLHQEMMVVEERVGMQAPRGTFINRCK